MASTTKKPEPGPEDDGQAAAAADTAADPEPSPEAGPVVLEYLDETPRTYLFPGRAPQSAERGDVCELPYDPADGRWGPTKRKPTRLHDAHPDEAEKRSARQSEARAAIHARAAEQAAAAAGEA